MICGEEYASGGEISGDVPLFEEDPGVGTFELEEWSREGKIVSCVDDGIAGG